MPEDLDWLYQARRDLYRRFPAAAVAFSADGQDVRWTGPLDIGVETGEIATALRDDGSLVVVQVRDAHIVDHDGPELTVNGADQMLGDFAGTARITPTLRAAAGSGLVLG